MVSAVSPKARSDRAVIRGDHGGAPSGVVRGDHTDSKHMGDGPPRAAPGTAPLITKPGKTPDLPGFGTSSAE